MWNAGKNISSRLCAFGTRMQSQTVTRKDLCGRCPKASIDYHSCQCTTRIPFAPPVPRRSAAASSTFLISPRRVHSFSKTKTPATTPFNMIELLIHDACRADDARAVQSLIDDAGEGASALLNAVNGLGDTPLIITAKGGFADLTQLLLKAGADVNIPDNQGSTPLLMACGYGRVDVVNALLAAGADPNIARDDGTTPLILAARDGRLDFAEALIARGANVEAIYARSGVTALWHAVSKRHTDLVKLLLQKDANVNTADPATQTMLRIACMLNQLEILPALVDAGANVDATDQQGRSELLCATRQGRLEAVQILIKAGANVLAADETGDTPLHAASAHAGADLMNALLGSGVSNAEVNVARIDGASPLHIASVNGNVNAMEALLAAGANVNAADATGVTALIDAATLGHPECVEVLLQSGAHVDQVTSTGLRALAHAYMNNHHGIMETLVKAGADVNATDSTGLTPFDHALQSDLSAIVSVLLAAGARIGDPLNAARAMKASVKETALVRRVPTMTGKDEARILEALPGSGFAPQVRDATMQLARASVGYPIGPHSSSPEALRAASFVLIAVGAVVAGVAVHFGQRGVAKRFPSQPRTRK